MVATTAVIVIDGDKVPLTCLQLKNNAPGILYQGEKLQCYAPADGASNVCDNLGLHSWQIKELDACTRCCPMVTTNGPPKTKPSTTTRPTKVSTSLVNYNHGGKGRGKPESIQIHNVCLEQGHMPNQEIQFQSTKCDKIMKIDENLSMGEILVQNSLNLGLFWQIWLESATLFQLVVSTKFLHKIGY